MSSITLRVIQMLHVVFGNTFHVTIYALEYTSSKILVINSTLGNCDFVQSVLVHVITCILISSIMGQRWKHIQIDTKV